MLTGASRGIGRALALELARRRCRLALVSRQREALEEVAAAVRQEGGEVAAFPADVADPGAMAHAVESAASFLGELRVVVANAGVGYHGESLSAPAGEVARVVGVNLLGVMNTLSAAAPFLRANGPGAIGVVSSLSGLIPYRGGGVYAATKAGLNAYLACLRLELAGTGITVGWVCPGPVDTRMIVDGVPHRKLPPLAKLAVPIVSPDKVARTLLRVLERGGGMRVFPWQGAFFVSFYRHFPSLAEKVLRLTGAGSV
ncbi:MAG: SDR family NAD(P)-dependent oxidoreductase [Thermoanaerobaculum sp.]